MSLTELLLEQYQGQDIPKYDNDPTSVEILTKALANHLNVKKAKQLLLQNMQIELDQLLVENETMQHHCNKVESNSYADIVVLCANLFNCVSPTSSEVLKHVFKTEKDIVLLNEELIKLNLQKNEYQQIELNNNQITQFISEINNQAVEVQNVVENINTQIILQNKKCEDLQLLIMQAEKYQKQLMEGVDLNILQNLLNKCLNEVK